MKKYYPLLILFTFLFQSSKAQNKQYIYYFNNQLQSVSKENATVIGKGIRKDSVFMVQYYAADNDRLFLIESYTDSLLNTLHGIRIVYHPNKKIAEKSFFNTNKRDKSFVLWDSIGRIIDSTVYIDDMPITLVRYQYTENNERQTVQEFDKTYQFKFPDEKATVHAIDGTVLNTVVWKELMYDNKYALKKDKTKDNTYLIYKLSNYLFNLMVAKDPKPKESDFFKTNQKFNIHEVDIQNNKLRSKDLKGSILVINFWFINCPPCRKEIPDLNELVAAYKDNAKVKFIAIALDNKTDLKAFLALHPFQYQIVANGRSVVEQYGVQTFPTHIIVDGEGKVYFHTVGSPRQLMFWMKKTINELLDKQVVPIDNLKI